MVSFFFFTEENTYFYKELRGQSSLNTEQLTVIKQLSDGCSWETTLSDISTKRNKNNMRISIHDYEIWTACKIVSFGYQQLKKLKT